MLLSKEIDLKTQLEGEDFTYENQHSTGDRTTEERQELKSTESSQRIEMERHQSILNTLPDFHKNMIKEGPSTRSSLLNKLKQMGLLDKNK